MYKHKLNEYKIFFVHFNILNLNRLTGRHKFSLCRTHLLPKDASCTVITENDRSQEQSQKP